MAKRPKKFLKSDFGKKKLSLPKSLGFLKSFKFHSIIEDYSGKNTVRTVEVKPQTLKKLIDTQEKYFDLNLEKLSFEELYKEQKQEYEALQKKHSEMLSNYEILYKLSNKLPDGNFVPSPTSYLNIMTESGINYNSKPLPGGMSKKLK